MLVHDPLVCTPVPASGGFSASYIGEVRGEMDGTYATELLKRQQNPDQPSEYFIKYSRFERTPTLTSSFGRLGYVQMTFVQPGACLTSATITAFYKDGTTSMVTGVSEGDPISLFGNSPSLVTDSDVGVFGEVSQGMPIVNTGYLTGSAISATLVTKVFSSPVASTSSSANVVAQRRIYAACRDSSTFSGSSGRVNAENANAASSAAFDLSDVTMRAASRW